MAYLADFAPWIAVWILAARNGDERQTLLVACLVALGISVATLIAQGRRIGVVRLGTFAVDLVPVGASVERRELTPR